MEKYEDMKITKELEIKNMDTKVLPLVLDYLSPYEDFMELIDGPDVNINIVHDYLSNNEWRNTFINYPIKKVLPEDLKVRVKIFR